MTLPSMAWTVLFVAGLLEVGWAIGLKYTDGFTWLWPSIWTGISMVASVVLLAMAVKHLPIGTGYAVWTGIGTIGTAILGLLLFTEPATAMRLGCIGLIVAGIVGLKLAERPASAAGGAPPSAMSNRGSARVAASPAQARPEPRPR